MLRDINAPATARQKRYLAILARKLGIYYNEDTDYTTSDTAGVQIRIWENRIKAEDARKGVFRSKKLICEMSKEELNDLHRDVTGRDADPDKLKTVHDAGCGLPSVQLTKKHYGTQGWTFHEPRPDWHKLDPKDRSAVLHEQEMPVGFGNVDPGTLQVSLHCPNGLLELRNWLKREISDELNASGKYGEAATKMTHFKLPIFASALKHMSDDEMIHHGILEIIVDVITEKCGK